MALIKVRILRIEVPELKYSFLTVRILIFAKIIFSLLQKSKYQTDIKVKNKFPF